MPTHDTGETGLVGTNPRDIAHRSNTDFENPDGHIDYTWAAADDVESLPLSHHVRRVLVDGTDG